MTNNDFNEINELDMTPPDYTGEIVDLIKSNLSPATLIYRLEDYHCSDVAEALPILSAEERKKFFRLYEAAQISDVLEYSKEEHAGTYLEEMDRKKAASVLSLMETDAAADALHFVSKQKRSALIDCMDEGIKKNLALLASFDEDDIGSRMTTNFVLLESTFTVKQAMNTLVEAAAKTDHISTLFVTDEKGVYRGAITLKDLIIARNGTPLDELTATSYPYLYAWESVDDCIERLKDYSEELLPVLDNANRPIGVITSQSIIELVDDEMGDDYAKLAGLTAEEDLNEPLRVSLKKRLPWLFILLGLGMLVSAVTGTFELVIAQLPLVICFQSLVLSMSGNAGTQSLAVTIRVLSDENLTAGQKLKLVFKETRISLFNGLLLGMAAVVVTGLYIMLFKEQSFSQAFAVSGCIGISLVFSMLISGAVGTLIPLLFKKLNVDPAVASGPLITTVNDLVAVVTYYGLAWILLSNAF